MTETVPTQAQVQGFLVGVHGNAVGDVQPLAGGFWSSAFAYGAGGRELVLRVGTVLEGFEMDRAAMAFAGPDLPVPEVLDVGEGLGSFYAISVRHHGRFLETVRPDEADVAGATLVRTLAALRAVPAAPAPTVGWYAAEMPGAPTWRRWLTDGLVDDPRRRASGWRGTLAADVELDRLFRACERRIAELVEACPERRDLVHGDLLNRNVLISEDASSISAVFSWKCSVRGDFLYDVAWCTFWGAWHPGIAAVDVFGRVTASTAPGDTAALTDAALRHHCYELQIGATHLGWSAWTGNAEDLRAVASRTAAVLERGPLRPPPALTPVS